MGLAKNAYIQRPQPAQKNLTDRKHLEIYQLCPQHLQDNHGLNLLPGQEQNQPVEMRPLLGRRKTHRNDKDIQP